MSSGTTVIILFLFFFFFFYCPVEREDTTGWGVLLSWHCCVYTGLSQTVSLRDHNKLVWYSTTSLSVHSENCFDFSTGLSLSSYFVLLLIVWTYCTSKFYNGWQISWCIGCIYQFACYPYNLSLYKKKPSQSNFRPVSLSVILYSSWTKQLTVTVAM